MKNKIMLIGMLLVAALFAIGSVSSRDVRSTPSFASVTSSLTQTLPNPEQVLPVYLTKEQIAEKQIAAKRQASAEGIEKPDEGKFLLEKLLEYSVPWGSEAQTMYNTNKIKLSDEQNERLVAEYNRKRVLQETSQQAGKLEGMLHQQLIVASSTQQVAGPSLTLKDDEEKIFLSMIHIKNELSIQKMAQAGSLLSDILASVEHLVKPGVSTAEIDRWIETQLQLKGLVSRVKGYMGYRHVSCISLNDAVIHGVPRADCFLQLGDLVKIDVCASWNGYCADMARSFFVGQPSEDAQKLVDVAYQALKKGIDQARVGNKLSDISAAIQDEVEKHGFSVIRDFAGHGIGKNMHEAPEIMNYGKPGKGPVLREGMTFAIEPMITAGKYHVYIAEDGSTVKTVDHSLAVHVEDTIVITRAGPVILTRKNYE